MSNLAAMAGAMAFAVSALFIWGLVAFSEWVDDE